MGNIFAVLTGDLVKSRRLPDEQLNRVRAGFHEAVGEVKQWERGLVRGTPEFFRGDAWQMVLAKPEWALRVAVFLRASLLADNLADTRVVIGLGSVDRLNPKRVSLSTGQAFALSGEMLDELTLYFRMSVALSKEAGELAGWLRVVGHLCGGLIGHWTRRQAEIIRMALHPDELTQAEVGERLEPPIKKQTVAKALAGADWHVLRSALKQFEVTDWEKVLWRDGL